MASPEQSASADIDLFSHDQAPTGVADSRPLPTALVDPPVQPRLYHSAQLAVIIGVFAFGGFLCSFFFVDRGDDFPQPHHWLRKSYRRPVITIPPGPPILPQVVPLRRSRDERTAGLHHPPVMQRKIASSPSRIDHSGSGFKPVTDLKTRWAVFSENFGASVDSARNRALDFGRRLRQYHFEAGKVSVSGTDKKTDDAG